jgi:hypothetical protein
MKVLAPLRESAFATFARNRTKLNSEPDAQVCDATKAEQNY